MPQHHPINIIRAPRQVQRLSLRLLSFVLLCCVLPLPVWAQDSVQSAKSFQSETQSVGQRPRIGMSFGGGGAKGAAHIGVLKYIVEQGIPIDYVTGTSMGSIIGGLYALGYSPEEMTDIISSLDWSVYITNSLDRRFRSSFARQQRSTALISVPFNLGKLDSNIAASQQRGSNFLASLPSSFMGGSNLTNLFNNLSLGYQDSMSFDSLPIPFACVATDIATGDGVVLRSGRFPTAIRASMAIPSVFSPVEIDGRMLVDGGLVNNFPVDICKEMGADIVIGSEVAAELVDDISQLQSLPQLLSQFMNIAVKGNKLENRKMCDIYMHPDVSGYNMLSFNKAAIDTLVQRGYRCAQEHSAEILALKERLEAMGVPMGTQFHRHPAETLGTDSLVLMSIKMNGISESDQRWLLSKSQLVTGRPIPGTAVSDAAGIFKGTGAFSSITYRMSDCSWALDIPGDSARYDSYHLEMDFVPASPHAFSLGLRYDSEESAALLLNVGFNRNKLRGFKADISLRLAHNFRVEAVGSLAVRRFATLNLAYKLHNVHNDIGSLDLPFYTSTHFYRHNFSFYFSEFYLRNVSGAAGIEEEFLLFDRYQAGNAYLFGDGNLRSGILGVFARFKYDSRDDSYFARTGAHVAFEAHYRIDNHLLVADSVKVPGFADAQAAYQHYITPREGRFTIIPQVYTRFIIGSDYHFAYSNLVGGEMMGRYTDYQFPFIGILVPQQVDRCLTVLRLDLRCRIGKKHYVSAMGNYLASADAYWHYFSAGYRDRYGVGLQYAYDSPVGPLSLTAFWSNVYKSFGAYVSLGYTF